MPCTYTRNYFNSIHTSNHLRSYRILALALLALALPTAARAVDLDYNFQNAALDQPQINASISLNGTTAQIDPNGVDPNSGLTTNTINFQPYFDTGASGLLLSSDTAAGFNVPLAQSGGQNVTYADIGVGGNQNFNVSQPIYLSFAPNNPTVDIENISNYTQKIGPVQVQVSQDVANPSDPLSSLTQTPDVIGTPAMQGKVVVIDSVALNRGTKQLISGDLNNVDLNDFSLRTYVYNPGTPFVGGDTNPGIPTSNFHIKLSSASFNQFSAVTPAGATGPALANNPFIGPNPVTVFNGGQPDTTPKVKISYNGVTTQGSFLLDTGSAASMISNALAQQLHIIHETSDLSSPLEYVDPANPSNPIVIPDQFNLTVSGIGSSEITRPGFYLDSLLLTTMENTSGLDSDPNNLNFLHVPVLVNDITVQDPNTNLPLTLDGIFGMNLLTATEDASGDILSNPGTLAFGAFNYITYDNVNGTLGLQLEAQAVPEPSSAVLAAFGFCLAGFSLRRKLKS